MAQIKTKIGQFFGFSKEEVVLDDGFILKKDPAIPVSGSMYSAGVNGSGASATATISSTVVKAVALSLAEPGEKVLEAESYGCVTYNGSVKKSYAEIKNTYNGEVTTDVCIYSETSGAVSGGTIDEDGNILPIEIDYGKRQGTAVLLAMLPVILKDKEAQNLYNDLKLLGFGTTPLSSKSADEIEKIRKNLATLSDNIYFRVKDGTLKCSIETRGKCSPNLITKAAIDSGAYAPDLSTGAKILGAKGFEILVSSSFTPKTGKAATYDKESFLKSYILNPKRTLDAKETALIPELPDYYEIPKEAVITCNNIVKSTSKNRPWRNVLLKGPAGTGKTQLSKAIASALHLPYTHITCDAGMELFNLIGTILPATEGVADMTAEELAEKIDLPTVEDIMFDKDKAYLKLTGESEVPLGLSEMEVIQMLFDKQMEVIKGICSDGQAGQDFVYVPSELIKAVKYGWVCEVQEPTVIIQPGVLPGLNSMLEGGSISLPTGEIVKRHPDSVIVFTTNLDYEGCRSLNESVLDRFPMKFNVEMPETASLIERASKITGLKNTTTISNCMAVLNEIREYLLSQGCGIGNVGPRTFYDWLDAVEMGYSELEAAEFTVLTSASDDEEIKDYIRTNILEVAF